MIPTLEEIKRILWEDWDPIGVNSMSDAADEYDSYALQIYSKKASGADVKDIEKYLGKVETEFMGITLTASHNRLIAEKIMIL